MQIAPRGRRISPRHSTHRSNRITSGAVRWSCARCGVSAGRIDGKRAAQPVGWTDAGQSNFCLSCSRALAGDAAIDSAPSGSSREELVKLRRTGLIEFEIRRSPEAPNRTIANACHTSTGAVAAVRDGLVPHGVPLPEPPVRVGG